MKGAQALRFAGVGGLVLLLFGVLSLALTRRFDLWVAAHVAGGGTLALIAVAANVAALRRGVASRRTRLRGSAWGGVVLFAVLLVLLNGLIARGDLQWDLTESEVHSLSRQTRDLLSGVQRPVELIGFFDDADPRRAEAVRLLERFAAQTDAIDARVVDPARRPDLALARDVREAGVVVATCGDRRATARSDVARGIGEELLADLVRRVTRTREPVAYAVAGHGEAAADAASPRGMAAFATALRESGFVVETLLLAARPEVPPDADLVLLVGPEKPLAPREIDALATYLESGGALLALLEPAVPAGLDPLLERFGLRAVDDFVVDPALSMMGGAELGLQPIVEDFGEHPAVRGFEERIVLPTARSIEAFPGTSGGGELLARSHASAWSERDYRTMLRTGALRQDEGDPRGPLGLVGAAESRGTRVVLAGDADFARNAHFGALHNREFLLRCAAWLVGEEGRALAAPRRLRPSRIAITGAEYRRLFRLSVLLVPEALLLVGLGVWWWRRSL